MQRKDANGLGDNEFSVSSRVSSGDENSLTDFKIMNIRPNFFHNPRSIGSWNVGQIRQPSVLSFSNVSEKIIILRHIFFVKSKLFKIVTSRKTRKRKALKKNCQITRSQKKLLNKTNKNIKKLNLRLDRIHSSILDANKYL